eukprot:364183-Chlamydomonas_euryale.AAC.15
MQQRVVSSAHVLLSKQRSNGYALHISRLRWLLQWGDGQQGACWSACASVPCQMDARSTLKRLEAQV